MQRSLLAERKSRAVEREDQSSKRTVYYTVTVSQDHTLVYHSCILFVCVIICFISCSQPDFGKLSAEVFFRHDEQSNEKTAVMTRAVERQCGM